MKFKTEVNEKLANYSGKEFYALVSRMGGKGKDIHALTAYRVAPNGTTHFQFEIMHCVANKKQFADMEKLTNGNYVKGRPTPLTALQYFQERKEII